MKRPLIILGAGGFAREVYSWLDPETHCCVGFYTNEPKGPFLSGLQVYGSLDDLRSMEFVAAVGDPALREKLTEQAQLAGLVASVPIMHKSVVVGCGAEIYRGAILCPNVVVGPDVKIGRGVILNLGVTVGHDSELDEYVTVSPGANISGNVMVGRSAYLGTNSCIREKLRIGEKAIVGMGAVVVKDVEALTTVMSVAARPIDLKAVRA